MILTNVIDGTKWAFISWRIPFEELDCFKQLDFSPYETMLIYDGKVVERYWAKSEESLIKQHNDLVRDFSHKRRPTDVNKMKLIRECIREGIIEIEGTDLFVTLQAQMIYEDSLKAIQ